MLMIMSILAFTVASLVPSGPAPTLTHAQLGELKLGASGLSVEALAVAELADSDVSRVVAALGERPCARAALGFAMPVTDGSDQPNDAPVSTHEACEAAGLSPATIAAMIRGGELQRAGLPVTWVSVCGNSQEQAALVKAVIREQRSLRLGTTLDRESRDLLSRARSSSEVARTEATLTTRVAAIRNEMEVGR